MEEIWKKHSDSEMTKLWILSHPFNFVSIIIIGVTIVALVLPKIVSKYAKFFNRDYRPLIIVYNGFIFGSFGVGLPLIYITTRKGADLFSCHAVNERRTDLSAMALKQLAIVFLVLLILELGIFVIRIMNRKKLVTMVLVHQITWIMIMFTTLTLHPVGSPVFAASMYMITRIAACGYMVLNVASVTRRSWRLWIQLLEISANILTVIHHVYYLTRGCGSPFALSITGGYCAIRACLLTLKFMTTCTPRTKRAVL